MNRILCVVVAILACVGCGKNQKDTEGPSYSMPAATSGPVHDWVTVDDVRVRVDRVQIGKVPMIRKQDGKEERFQSTEERIAMHFTVENLSETRKIEGGFLFPPPKLIDEFGNAYSMDNLMKVNLAKREAVFPEGLKNTVTVYPKKTETFALFFQPPVEKASLLKLSLPGRGLQLKNDFEFALPSKAWK